MPGMMNMFQLSMCPVLNWRPPKGNRVSLPKRQPQVSKPTSKEACQNFSLVCVPYF